MGIFHLSTWLSLLHLLAVLGLASSYFPGLTPEDSYRELCEQATRYTAGGTKGKGAAPFQIKPNMDEYIPGHDIKGRHHLTFACI